MVRRSKIISSGEVCKRVVCKEVNVCSNVYSAAGTTGNHVVTCCLVLCHLVIPWRNRSTNQRVRSSRANDARIATLVPRCAIIRLKFHKKKPSKK
jgi:hypothetical protein